MAETPISDWTWLNAAADRFERRTGFAAADRGLPAGSRRVATTMLLEELLRRRARSRAPCTILRRVNTPPAFQSVRCC